MIRQILNIRLQHVFMMKVRLFGVVVERHLNNFTQFDKCYVN